MTTKRKDNRGRILQTGESQRKDGRYAYKYVDSHGDIKFVYSWLLNPSDSLPKGKRPCLSLRELEQELQKDRLDGIDTSGKKLTVCQLYEKQNNLKPNVRTATVKGRNQLMKLLDEDKLGHMYIDSVKPSDCKEWALRMNKKGYAYQTINNYKRSLKGAFYMAVTDNLVRKNPFSWSLSDVLKDDTVHKQALTKEQVEKLLTFVKNDEVYKRHYNAIVVLLNTGLRISELCGLTDNDIDFENNYINVNHQLLKDKSGYHVTEPKTESGIRKIPMLDVTRKALQEQMNSRTGIKKINVDGYTDFLFNTASGYPAYSDVYISTFSLMIKKYNKMYKDDTLPAITPHVLRHTFCTNMAFANMNPKNLQYILGHKHISITLDYYTHASCESAMEEMMSITA